MSATVRCSGCGQVVDVSAPVGVEHRVVQDTARDLARQVTISIGHVIVHRCRLCADGHWR